MHPHKDEALERRIRDVLRPFAKMFRPLDHESDELAMVRGTASDMSAVTCRDLAAAFDLLIDLRDPEMVEALEEDDRYLPRFSKPA